ncbi:MAG: OmpA family protein [Rhodospirillaceae bacterium]|nr:OmpA family protein [Rhodospirillaceae bacterium]
MGRFFGFLVAGLAGVLIVGAVAIYGLDGTGRIEAGLQDAAGRKLAETGPPWASVEVRGRDAILKGEALLPAQRRQAAEKASLVIDAIPGIREVRDNTTARFKSMADLERRLADSCKQAASELPGAWLKCAVKGQTVTLSGAALTEPARRNGVDKVSAAVESLKARETIGDTTTAHYRSLDGMRAAFAGACSAAIAGFALNWMRCTVLGRNVSLSGRAPLEAEREARVAKARALLQAIKGVEAVSDETTSMPALATPAACRKAIEARKGDLPIRFAAGTAVIDPKSHALLDALTIAAKRCTGVTIEIQGHTDPSGKPDADRKLSEAQASAVAAYMTDRGVPAGRLSARGYGADKPLTADDTDEARAKNRRIEFAMSK